ncbi:MAG: hypothetical protein ACI379_12905 [Nocardioides sp.]|uniref:hypothetical protein n=1 Tax=Nocardioides sp. TaxID=35761 RepID=UPI003F0B8295
MTINVQGAIETPVLTGAFGAALLEDLAHVLPSIGLSPVAVALTQHETRHDGAQPALLLVLGEGQTHSQLLDVGQIGMATVFNDVLPRVTPRASAPAPTYAPVVQQTAPAAAPPVTAAPATAPAAPTPAEPEAPQAPGGAVGEARIWGAFEDALRPQLGRGTTKAVEATRKGAAGMSEAQLLEFLADRLGNFGAATVESFRSALHG